ncbi:MAG: hypothetical protein ABJO36_12485 [Litorimonas sp.]
MIDPAALALNADCYCWPVTRELIIKQILQQNASPHMEALLSDRPHYFASTTIFLAKNVLEQMSRQVHAIETVVRSPKYIEMVRRRGAFSNDWPHQSLTDGAFMGYDFHITDDGPRLIEINSNAGGAFIVNMIEQAVRGSSLKGSLGILDMFQSEWKKAGRIAPLQTIAIVDGDPQAQYHYPDMCLAKTMLESQGLKVVIVDPKDLSFGNGRLRYENTAIDLVYNRLTDFDLSEKDNALIRQAYENDAAVVTPAPHHHALYADKRNLILLSDPASLKELGASQGDIDILKAIPKTVAVTPDRALEMWEKRRKLFFKPQAGFGSRGAFRGAKLTKKVWADILKGGYIAQDLISPPVRAVTIDGNKAALKFDFRVYTYDGHPLLYAARIYQGQTTNLRTAGGGLAAVVTIDTPSCYSFDKETNGDIRSN